MDISTNNSNASKEAGIWQTGYIAGLRNITSLLLGLILCFGVVLVLLFSGSLYLNAKTTTTKDAIERYASLIEKTETESGELDGEKVDLSMMNEYIKSQQGKLATIMNAQKLELTIVPLLDKLEKSIPPGLSIYKLNYNAEKDAVSIELITNNTDLVDEFVDGLSANIEVATVGILEKERMDGNDARFQIGLEF